MDSIDSFWNRLQKIFFDSPDQKLSDARSLAVLYLKINFFTYSSENLPLLMGQPLLLMAIPDCDTIFLF